MDIQRFTDRICHSLEKGNYAAAFMSLRNLRPLLACAICAQVVLRLMDHPNSELLPKFIEAIESAAFTDYDRPTNNLKPVA